MWVKALIKWLLLLFRWGQTTLEPLADSINSASASGTPAGTPRQAPSTSYGSNSSPGTSLLDLAAEVAELRSEVRALRRILVERA
jgi:hypothetical protein